MYFYFLPLGTCLRSSIYYEGTNLQILLLSKKNHNSFARLRTNTSGKPLPSAPSTHILLQLCKVRI